MPSKAFSVFDGHTAKELKIIIGIFLERNTNRGPNTNYGLLYGGLILMISGWESYCEDVSREAVKQLTEKENIAFSQLPESTKQEILKFSYPARLENKNPLETNLAKLPDNGWKELFADMLEEYLRDFNTPKFSRPNGKCLKKLFKLFLHKNVSSELGLLTRVNDHSEEIDKIISIRGDIAHRGKPKMGDRFDARKLTGYLKQVTSACAAIDCVIQTEFMDRYQITPWRITSTVTRHLPGLVLPKGE